MAFGGFHLTLREAEASKSPNTAGGDGYFAFPIIFFRNPHGFQLVVLKKHNLLPARLSAGNSIVSLSPSLSVTHTYTHTHTT